MWTQTDSWQQNQLKRFTLGIASKEQCNQEIRKLMDSVLSQPPANRPPATKGFLQPWAYNCVRDLLKQISLNSRYLGVKKPFLILISSPHLKHLRSKKFVTLVLGDSNRIILKKKKKKQLLLFHILQNALSYRSTFLTADKFARALWLLKLSALKSTGFHKSSILILWVFHYKQITIWCLNWWKDAYGLIAPMQHVMSWDTHLHPYSRVCISQMWMTTL